MSERLSCFKAYDIRGKVPAELNADLARRIGLAYAAVIRPSGPVVVGHDCRESSAELSAALIEGLNRGGVATRDIGLCGTELVYHAAARPGLGGGIMITASHNPRGDNGLKMVAKDPARGVIIPVTADEGLDAMEQHVRLDDLPGNASAANEREDVVDGYLARVRGILGDAKLRPLKIVANAGNGCAGPFFDRLVEPLGCEVVRLHHEADGTFPNGVPNPLLPENREATSAAVRAHGADFGVAWDGDFDRCFFFDHEGEFVEGYYIVRLLAERLLQQHGGGRIVHDPRLYWNTLDGVAAAPGGTAVKCRTGHARIKAMMVGYDCLYGGEMSAHHYFRDFAYCDSGMVPWLLVAAQMSQTGQSLAALVGERMAQFPCSGEINRVVAAPESAFRRVLEHFAYERPHADFFDGLSLTFGNRWRLNLRQSDTQPELLRLNVESRGDQPLMQAKTEETLVVLGG